MPQNVATDTNSVVASRQPTSSKQTNFTVSREGWVLYKNPEVNYSMKSFIKEFRRQKRCGSTPTSGRGNLEDVSCCGLDKYGTQAEVHLKDHTVANTPKKQTNHYVPKIINIPMVLIDKSIAIQNKLADRKKVAKLRFDSTEEATKWHSKIQGCLSKEERTIKLEEKQVHHLSLFRRRSDNISTRSAPESPIRKLRNRDDIAKKTTSSRVMAMKQAVSFGTTLLTKTTTVESSMRSQDHNQDKSYHHQQSLFHAHKYHGGGGGGATPRSDPMGSFREEDINAESLQMEQQQQYFDANNNISGTSNSPPSSRSRRSSSAAAVVGSSSRSPTSSWKDRRSSDRKNKPDRALSIKSTASPSRTPADSPQTESKTAQSAPYYYQSSVATTASGSGGSGGSSSNITAFFKEDVQTCCRKKASDARTESF
eukprot:jgi/Bigna1/74344/fgenesh1_pg.28_\